MGIMHAAWRRRNGRAMSFVAFLMLIMVTYALADDGRTKHPDDPNSTTGAPSLYFCQVLDAQAFGPTIDSAISQDPDEAVAPSWTRVGAIADGASVLVLRVGRTDGQPINDTVTISLYHSNTTLNPQKTGPAFPQTATFIGFVLPFDPTDDRLGFPLLPAPDYNDGAPTLVSFASSDEKIAYYCPPADFMFGQEASEVVHAQVTVGTLVVGTCDIQLKRSPVVFAHGVCSSMAAMTDMQNSLLKAVPGLDTDNFDYSAHNTDGYDTNIPLVKSEIASQIANERSKGFAATRVDWVAHSMGGDLAKWYASDIPAFRPVSRARAGWSGGPDFVWGGCPFKRNDDFGLGDLRRVVTLDSPLDGSPLADTIYTNFSYNQVNLVLITASSVLHGNGCACYDLGALTFTSSTLESYHPWVSWFPVVGEAAPDSVPSDLLNGSSIVTVLTSLYGDTVTQLVIGGYLLDATISDYVVLLTSSNDCQALAHQALVHDTVHTQATVGARFGPLAKEALDMEYATPEDSGYVAGCDFANPSF